LRYRPLRQGFGTLAPIGAISTQTIVPTLTPRLFVSEIEDFGKSGCARAFDMKKSAKST